MHINTVMRFIESAVLRTLKYEEELQQKEKRT
jgi:hypothetical protein